MTVASAMSEGAGWHLAQMNVGTARFDLFDPRMSGFVRRIDAINALAEQSAGFVWRMQGDQGNNTGYQATDDPRFIVNLSVWTGVEALFDYVYRSGHRSVMIKRREWFERPDNAHLVLWWVPAGHRPEAEEGLKRLAHLNEHGPTATAFDFKSVYPAPSHVGNPTDMQPDPYCVGWR